VRRLDAAYESSGTFASGDLPAAGLAMATVVSCRNGATASAIKIECSGGYKLSPREFA